MAKDAPIPGPEALEVGHPAYLNGLCEAASEMRRRCLDDMRRGDMVEAERLLGAMDEVYDVLVTFDFPDAVTGGLRRRVDQLRGVLERTRGDLTNSLRQERLIRALREFEERIENG
jgi:translin